MAQIPTHGPDGSEVLSVAEFTRRVKTAIERAVPRCWVRGEVSNLTNHSNGHIYFSLKDARAQVSCVLFRQDALRLRAPLKAGQEVVALGEPSLYEPQGRYQLVCRVVVDVGQGELQRRYEALKAKLDAEGLFAESRKRALPQWPRVIAVVTSPTGAAIADFISILTRRGYRGRVLLIPSRVQGDGAAAEIVAGIRLAGQWWKQANTGTAVPLNRNQGAEPVDGIQTDGEALAAPDHEALGRADSDALPAKTSPESAVAQNTAEQNAGNEDAVAQSSSQDLSEFSALSMAGVSGTLAEAKFPVPELLVVMRGGGSLEDLWPFNEEAVARALAASPLPTISAVGHQIDFSLSDFAADVRAETPSGAAELIATGFQALLERKDVVQRQLGREVSRQLMQARNRIQYAAQGVRGIHPQRIVERHWQRLDELQLRLDSVVRAQVERRRSRLGIIAGGIHLGALGAQLRLRTARVDEAAARLERISTTALAPVRARLEHIATRLSGLALHRALARGYALVRDKNGKVVSRKDGLHAGELLAIDFADGEILVRIEQV